MSAAVLITGCSTGLGLETAVYLAERGWRVYAGLRDLERRAALEAAARARGVRLTMLPLDITDPASIDRAVQQVLTEAGGIYGLVNNAGIGLRGYFEDLLESEVRRVFEVNVFGTMAMTRAVLPAMRAAGRGRIVIIGSVGGRIAAFGVSAYCATKFAQEGWAEALYQELRPLGIGVALVEPGIIRTERWGRNRAIGQRAQDPTSPYYRWFVAAEQLTDRLVSSSPARPLDVARVVHRVLAAPRPRLRYIVGWRPWLAVLLRRYLPEPVFERLYFGMALWRLERLATSLPGAGEGER
jgi:NAD(P)-dependent dehydrogenase (short-subunit alcohol dehydrogenase family)